MSMDNSSPNILIAQHDQPSPLNMLKDANHNNLAFHAHRPLPFLNESDLPTMLVQPDASLHFSSSENPAAPHPQIIPQAPLSSPRSTGIHLANSTTHKIGHHYPQYRQNVTQEKPSSSLAERGPPFFTQPPIPSSRELSFESSRKQLEDPSGFIARRATSFVDTLPLSVQKNAPQIADEYIRKNPASHFSLTQQVQTQPFSQSLPLPPHLVHSHDESANHHGSSAQIPTRSLSSPDISTFGGSSFNPLHSTVHPAQYLNQTPAEGEVSIKPVHENLLTKPMKRTYFEAIGEAGPTERRARVSYDSKPTTMHLNPTNFPEAPYQELTANISARKEADMYVGAGVDNISMYQRNSNLWNGAELGTNDTPLTNQDTRLLHDDDGHHQYTTSGRESLDGLGRDTESSDNSSANSPNMSPVSTQTEKSNDNPSTPYTCAQCAERFATAEKRKSHIRTAHGKRFPCSICKSQFTRRYDLNKHQQIVHEKIRPFVCDVCGSCFGQKHHLIRHKRALHMKAKDYACRMCPSRFSRDEHLHNHTRSIHGMWRPFMCSMCDVQCTDKRALKVHLESVHQVKSSRAGTFAGWQPDSRAPPPKIREILQM